MPKFEKTKGFQLKSGNNTDTTSFFKGEVKAVSPQGNGGLYYKSPLHEESDKSNNENGNENGDDNGDDKKKNKPEDKPGTKIFKALANAAIKGFDSATGMVTKRPTINWGDDSEEVDDTSPEDKIKKLNLEEGGGGDVFDWKNDDGTDKTIEEYNIWWDEHRKSNFE